MRRVNEFLAERSAQTFKNDKLIATLEQRVRSHIC